MKIGNKEIGKGWLIGGAVVLVILAIIAYVVGTSISVTNDGNKKEAALGAMYRSAQNELSDCLTKISGSANVAQAQSDAFTKAMTDVIKGRYDGREAQPGGMFSAIVENYPDLSGLNNAFARVQDVLIGCRTDFKNVQNRLLDQLREYDSWRTGSWTVRTFGGDYPSNNLVAQIGNDTSRRGQAALDQMNTIVTVEGVTDAYRGGSMKPDAPFGNSSTAPSTLAPTPSTLAPTPSR